jgi:hypothetical protein
MAAPARDAGSGAVAGGHHKSSSIRSRGAWAANIRTDLPELRASGTKSVTPAPTIEVGAEQGEALAVPVERAFAEGTDGAIVRVGQGTDLGWRPPRDWPIARFCSPHFRPRRSEELSRRRNRSAARRWALSTCQGMKRLRPHALCDEPRSRAPATNPHYRDNHKWKTITCFRHAYRDTLNEMATCWHENLKGK